MPHQSDGPAPSPKSEKDAEQVAEGAPIDEPGPPPAEDDEGDRSPSFAAQLYPRLRLVDESLDPSNESELDAWLQAEAQQAVAEKGRDKISPWDKPEGTSAPVVEGGGSRLQQQFDVREIHEEDNDFRNPRDPKTSGYFVENAAEKFRTAMSESEELDGSLLMMEGGKDGGPGAEKQEAKNTRDLFKEAYREAYALSGLDRYRDHLKELTKNSSSDVWERRNEGNEFLRKHCDVVETSREVCKNVMLQDLQGRKGFRSRMAAMMNSGQSGSTQMSSQTSGESSSMTVSQSQSQSRHNQSVESQVSSVVGAADSRGGGGQR
mmetsp:Transcript_18921/g.47258  ORF Transcript_18921/g.47258 Transcript_18921/m.47258 type:complete len:320 (-) Transcript_18921:252-1211(-)|eukprot:CAMPEP_0178995752 /NCGR_PEP_ID=MMETSP0795-20121207/7985_1 /TAXON_ID=88552 /ORGANISM="Amoebophrya sp., Strain Ameob2" /LENGTH=319 /DNA_ID=CAMNT_0020688061 /DNA_START=53 /DNA_END=1012 /DNA_ORIENTATION=+